MGSDFHMDFTKTRVSNRFSERFTESGLGGMLEMSDHDAVHNVFPFIGATVDECCSIKTNCKRDRSFSYVC